MKNGLYEKLLDLSTEERLLKNNNYECREVDVSEVARVVSLEFQKIIRKHIDASDKEKRSLILKELSRMFEVEEFEGKDEKLKELLAIHNSKEELDKLNKNRPLTSIATTSLFTGTSGPTLESELIREIKTSDRIDLLISFIKYSGFRLIRDALEEFTKEHELRIITTSYMGASDFNAILELSKLPNTKVKISYDTKRTRLHAKSYYFERETGYSTAYIGSSNISNPALSSGLEWNLKISEYTSPDAIKSLRKTFDIYWDSDDFVLFDPNNEEDKKNLKTSLNNVFVEDKNYTFFELRPFSHQKVILEDLEFSRKELNSYRNLVVSATGTGKTMVAGFDFKRFYLQNKNSKMLFLAHRKEILNQSMQTFRNILRDQNFGELWVDNNIPKDYEHIFASIQTLNSNGNFKKFDEKYFDYIIIDESHHSSSETYLNILNYFEPKILLGLTATPERMDGVDILKYFDNRIASEIRLYDAINQKLLAPFHYFGVTDPVDLSHMKWKRGKYDVEELTNVFTKSNQRIQVIVDSLNRYLNDIEDFKAIGFCVSIGHTEFMANSFNKLGIKSIALHSKSSSEERNNAITALKRGDIKCIFTVDLFNEGVDIPEIDTVLFLRPTESLTVFMQQLGRGLRLSEGKDVLTVLDYVGQANKNYDFSFKLRALIGKSKGSIEKEIQNEFPNLPVGCHIKFEKQAMKYVLNNIQSSILNRMNLKRMLMNFKNNFDLELNLKNFLESYGIDIKQFYSKTSFNELMSSVGYLPNYEQNDKYKISLKRLSNMNTKELIKFSIKVLSQEYNFNINNVIEKRRMGMLYYTIFNDEPETSYEKSICTLKKEEPLLVKEFIEILEYKLQKIDRKEIEYNEDEVPLELYGDYFLPQITAAVGKSDEKKKKSLREGALYVENINTDLFFITINKNENEYLPTTMYNDYAINSRYFNWESQSTTSIKSPTGQRYISKDKNHKVLLFVRDNKKEYGQTKPYTFIGKAKIKSYKGSNPIEIIWEMEEDIPEKIIIESKLSLAN